VPLYKNSGGPMAISRPVFVQLILIYVYMCVCVCVCGAYVYIYIYIYILQGSML